MINYDNFSRCHLTDIFFAFHAGAKELITAKEKKVFFRKQFSKFWASDNSDLQIKRSQQNITTDYDNYTHIKTILSMQIYLFVTVWKAKIVYKQHRKHPFLIQMIII